MMFGSFIVPILFLLYLIIPTGLLAVLEYFLSKIESPWPGRVLPILSGLNSLCISTLLMVNLLFPAPPRAVLIPVLALAILNLPTVVFLLVYRNTRRRYVEKKGVDRMNIQDL